MSWETDHGITFVGGGSDDGDPYTAICVDPFGGNDVHVCWVYAFDQRELTKKVSHYFEVTTAIGLRKVIATIPGFHTRAVWERPRAPQQKKKKPTKA